MLRCSPLSPALRRTTRQFLTYSLSILTMHTRTIARYSILRQAGKRLPALCLTLAIVACSLMPFASPTAWGGELQDDSRVWGAALTRGNFGYVSPDLKRWLWWMEGQLRARDCCSDGIALDQSLIRPGLGYALTDQSTVWIGYARVTNYLDGQGGEIAEDRMWEQYIWSGATPFGNFTFRPRLEQRWQANGGDTGSRFRQFLKFSWPISSLPGTDFVVWDEVFVNLYDTDWGPRLQSHLGFDQNRGFVGLGYRFSPEIKTEVGYMNQYIQTHSAANDRINHILSVWLFIDLYKK